MSLKLSTQHCEGDDMYEFSRQVIQTLGREIKVPYKSNGGIMERSLEIMKHIHETFFADSCV